MFFIMWFTALQAYDLNVIKSSSSIKQMIPECNYIEIQL